MTIFLPLFIKFDSFWLYIWEFWRQSIIILSGRWKAQKIWKTAPNRARTPPPALEPLECPPIWPPRKLRPSKVRLIKPFCRLQSKFQTQLLRKGLKLNSQSSQVKRHKTCPRHLEKFLERKKLPKGRFLWKINNLQRLFRAKKKLLSEVICLPRLFPKIKIKVLGEKKHARSVKKTKRKRPRCRVGLSPWRHNWRNKRRRWPNKSWCWRQKTKNWRPR